MSGGLSVTDLTVTKQETKIISNLSCQWDLGTMILLTGESGCGKTTLLHTIAGFSGVNYQGEILINNTCLKKSSMADRAQKVGLMFQNSGQQFTMRTLERELIFALENCQIPYEEARSRMDHAVAMMAMNAFLHRDLATLSGGEKQRAALTILIALDASILLLDEPFASIDAHSRHFLIQRFSELRNQGKLIVIVDHDLTGYREVVNHFIRMENGELVEEDRRLLPEKSSSLLLSKDSILQEGYFEFNQVKIAQGNRELLRPQTFVLSKGVTTLTGENGVGKSTLLRSMVQLHPYRGKMFLKEDQLSRYFGKKKLYQQMTMAVQQAEQQFVTLQVDTELSYPKKATTDIFSRQLQAIEDLGLQSLLNRSVYQLSEGQKKMIQLITLFGLNREVLLLDEPFSGLDQKASHYFTRWIHEKKEQTNFLIISHRLEPLIGVSEHHIHLSSLALQEVR